MPDAAVARRTDTSSLGTESSDKEFLAAQEGNLYRLVLVMSGKWCAHEEFNLNDAFLRHTAKPTGCSVCEMKGGHSEEFRKRIEQEMIGASGAFHRRHKSTAQH